MQPVESVTTPLCGHRRMAKRAAHAGAGVPRGPMACARAMGP